LRELIIEALEPTGIVAEVAKSRKQRPARKSGAVRRPEAPAEQVTETFIK
jgi:hypothetical protein